MQPFFLQRHVLVCIAGKDFEVRTPCEALLDVGSLLGGGVHICNRAPVATPHS